MTLLIIVILAALVFEYINGFHDSANAIATVVSTKVLTPKRAVIYAALLNFIGALMGTHVAQTIGKGIVESYSVTQEVILCALLAAIIWNLITWHYGIPSSSSHALIGGLIGSSLVHSGFQAIQFSGVIKKVVVPMITSPLTGFVIGIIAMILLTWIFIQTKPEKINRYFRKFQLVSSGIMALSHGSNDAQKTMGIITLALMTATASTDFHIPLWVIICCGITMALGTLAGGWKIIKTMGTKVIKLKPIHGFAAETAAAGVILTASHFGMPISTTHVISASIMGVGSASRLSAVRWHVVTNILTAWVMTIPVCMMIAAGCYYVFSLLGS